MSQPKTREERISHELEILEKQIAWLVDWHMENLRYDRDIVREVLRHAGERIDRLMTFV